MNAFSLPCIWSSFSKSSLLSTSPSQLCWRGEQPSTLVKYSFLSPSLNRWSCGTGWWDASGSCWVAFKKKALKWAVTATTAKMEHMVLEVTSLRSRCGQGRGLPRPLSLTCQWFPLAVSSHGASSMIFWNWHQKQRQQKQKLRGGTTSN